MKKTLPHTYLPKNAKSPQIRALLEEALAILSALGIPLEDKTERSLERIAMAFLAVAGITNSWKQATASRSLKTRDIITFHNEHFEENISSGSYDDIRRKDLKMLVLSGIVLNSSDNPNAATNDPRRGYSIDPECAQLLEKYRTPVWTQAVTDYLKNKTVLREQLSRLRTFDKVPIVLPNGVRLELSQGQHNQLQKLIIEEFLPRYGRHCQVLYVGDTANKLLHIDRKTLRSLHFFELEHDELPDIIAYNVDKNWLYLIEAVHSSGPISEIRRLELERLTKDCTADIIYVTAFLSRAEFRKWSSEIAWETEVWIADNPDHLIHFNGDKFLGPYSE
jgi:type II restriction enzyme